MWEEFEDTKAAIRIHIWPKEKVQKDKQRSTKHTYKTKDRVTRTPLRTGVELRCSRRVSSSCSTSDTRHVNLVTNPVISHERGKDREVFTSGTYPWSFVTQIFHNNVTQTKFGRHIVFKKKFKVQNFQNFKNFLKFLNFHKISKSKW